MKIEPFDPDAFGENSKAGRGMCSARGCAGDAVYQIGSEAKTQAYCRECAERLHPKALERYIVSTTDEHLDTSTVAAIEEIIEKATSARGTSGEHPPVADPGSDALYFGTHRPQAEGYTFQTIDEAEDFGRHRPEIVVDKKLQPGQIKMFNPADVDPELMRHVRREFLKFLDEKLYRGEL